MFSTVSAAEIMGELPRLNEADREAVLGKLLESMDSPVSSSDEALVESRLAEHRADSSSSVPLGELRKCLRRSDVSFVANRVSTIH